MQISQSIFSIILNFFNFYIRQNSLLSLFGDLYQFNSTLFSGKCDLCMLSFDNLEGMRRHHKERHQTKSAICPKCNLPQKRHLIDHVPCKFKDGINPKEENKVLDDPPKKVTGGSKFVRTTDRPTMKTREAVHTHLLKEGEDPDTFKTFTSHLLKVESSGLSRWFCSFCRIEFPAKKFLNKHTMTVHKGKKYYLRK